MPLFSNILVHLDAAASSHPVLAVAAGLARRSRGRITLVDVAPDWSRARVDTTERYQALVQSAQSAALAKAASGLARRHIPVETRVLESQGSTAAAVVREAVRGGYDVLLRSHGVTASATPRSPFGPIDMDLLRHCPCPVWLVRPPAGAVPARVLVAVNPGEHEGLSARLLDLALELKRTTRASITVLHVWEAFGEGLLRPRMTPAEHRAYIDHARRDAAARVAALTSARRVPATSVLLVRGEPARVIPRVARQRNADLVVMGTVARTGLRGFVMGNTAERALGALPCSVLAIKPEGFGSEERGARS